jgi:uncharacterized protein (TIGR03067 family)
MRIRILIVAVAVLGLTAFAPAPFPKPDRKDDLKGLAGTWTVTRYEREGRAVRTTPTMKVRIEGNKWSFLLVDATGIRPTTSYTFTLDPKKDPRLIDLTRTGAGVAAGNNKLMGIYRFEHRDRDRMQVVFHTFGVTRRPDGFDGVDKEAYLLVLQREKK